MRAQYFLFASLATVYLKPERVHGYDHRAHTPTSVQSCEEKNKFGMVFCRIPKGQFLMGFPEDEIDDDSIDENFAPKPAKPQHLVTITKDFEIMATEVTQAMWFALLRESPSKFASKDTCINEFMAADNICPNHPVDSVTWDDVINNFLPRLNQQLKEEGYIYRLPTEAEWEYAARGARNEPFGIDGNPEKFAWTEDNSSKQTHSVGELRSNAYGLFDMHGNVSEWVQNINKYRSRATVDRPNAMPRSWARMLRGGSWYTNSSGSRSATRYVVASGYRGHDVGFRIVRQESPYPVKKH